MAEIEMLPVHYGLIGMAALAILIGLGVRIFVAAGVVGFCGLWALLGFAKAVGVAGHIPYSDTTNYALSVLPLFILIGHLAHHAGILGNRFDEAILRQHDPLRLTNAARRRNGRHEE